MRRGEWGDPAGIIERRQVAGCHGCAHEIRIFDMPACGKDKRYGKRCKQYGERKAMTIQDRLENWGRVVRSPRFQAGVCASWAKWYLALRDKGNEPAAVIRADERDGWAIEKCWAAMMNQEAKWILKYHYVWKMAPDQIATRLRKTHKVVLRGQRFDLLLAEAHRAISRELVRLDGTHRAALPQECEIA